jgi:hypothetical protein
VTALRNESIIIVRLNAAGVPVKRFIQSDLLVKRQLATAAGIPGAAQPAAVVGTPLAADAVGTGMLL